MIISSPPSPEYPTGILSIQIHEITGLEYDNIQSNQANADDYSDAEGAGDLPSSYCNVILNHRIIFKTRTKPKNTNPFFNAGTERVIRDWRDAEIIISVRDARSHENDPLLGIVYLRLLYLFEKRSQIIDQFPLVGGLGCGRARISLVFRSVQLQAPKELLGWEYGTLEVTGPITSQDLTSDLRGLRLKLRTTVNRVKMYSSSSEEGVEWRGRKDRAVRLAVRKRYSTCLVIEFRKNNLGLDQTPAFAVLWLKDIPDQEEMTLTLPIWPGDTGLKRAEANCIQEFGQKMGTLRVPLKFWRGLSRYHHKLASKSSNLQDVLEVLEIANKIKEASNAISDEDPGSSSSSSSSSDSGGSEDDDLLSPIRKRGKKLSAALTGKDMDQDRDGEDDGRRGPLDQIQEYKDHSDEIHRQHRGVMQWKVSTDTKLLWKVSFSFGLTIELGIFMGFVAPLIFILLPHRSLRFLLLNSKEPPCHDINLGINHLHGTILTKEKSITWITFYYQHIPINTIYHISFLFIILNPLLHSFPCPTPPRKKSNQIKSLSSP